MLKFLWDRSDPAVIFDFPKVFYIHSKPFSKGYKLSFVDSCVPSRRFKSFGFKVFKSFLIYLTCLQSFLLENLFPLWINFSIVFHVEVVIRFNFSTLMLTPMWCITLYTVRLSWLWFFFLSGLSFGKYSRTAGQQGKQARN